MISSTLGLWCLAMPLIAVISFPHDLMEFSVATTTKEMRERAEARFRKAEVAATAGQKARAEYDAEINAVRNRTARLRAERLAREQSTSPSKDPQAG